MPIWLRLYEWRMLPIAQLSWRSCRNSGLWNWRNLSNRFALLLEKEFLSKFQSEIFRQSVLRKCLLPSSNMSLWTSSCESLWTFQFLSTGNCMHPGRMLPTNSHLSNRSSCSRDLCLIEHMSQWFLMPRRRLLFGATVDLWTAGMSFQSATRLPMCQQ